MYSFDSFLEETANALKNPKYSGLRPGQIYMNLLYDRRAYLYHQIKGTSLDPFYVDSRATEFWRYLKDNW